jgi:hypothetical protein
MSADTTGHKRAAGEAEAGVGGAATNSVGERQNKKRKVARDTKAERARIERMRTRRIARLMSQLRCQVLDDDPNSKTDRIAVLSAAVRLIVALRKKVAEARAARMLAPQAIAHHSTHQQLYGYRKFDQGEAAVAEAMAAAHPATSLRPVQMAPLPMMQHPQLPQRVYQHPGHMIPSLQPGRWPGPALRLYKA